mmetsp:Transcript_79364/g.144967  ORF Transcript_79364/g.144967 Transcript_79364/m.144967 type:complete len:284 (-) Transcript_79364:74-925(-)
MPRATEWLPSSPKHRLKTTPLGRMAESAAGSAGMDAAAADGLAKRIDALHKDLNVKKTFCAACRNLAEISEKGDELPSKLAESLAEAGKRAFTVLKARFSNPKFWQAGLEFFLALEFHLPSVTAAAGWRETAMEEVDDEARERAAAKKEMLKLEEERKHHKGRWCDARTPLTQAQMAAAEGMILVEDEGRPGMSAAARHELRLVTVVSEDVCPICQEALPIGCKAKAMPCGHIYHDDCLMSWVAKNNSCPMCRYDELPSEKRHFDDDERRIRGENPLNKGIFS